MKIDVFNDGYDRPFDFVRNGSSLLNYGDGSNIGNIEICHLLKRIDLKMQHISVSRF